MFYLKELKVAPIIQFIEFAALKFKNLLTLSVASPYLIDLSLVEYDMSAECPKQPFSLDSFCYINWK